MIFICQVYAQLHNRQPFGPDFDLGDLNSNTWGPLLGPCGYHQFLDGFWYWAYHIAG